MRQIKPIDPDNLTPAQAEIYKQIATGERGRVSGPFTVLLHSPGAASRVEQVGAYLRYKSNMSDRIRELAICVVSYKWKANVEWASHAPLALKYGVPTDVIEAIGTGREPPFDDDKDRIAYQYVREVQTTEGASDATLKAAHEAFGEEGLVDLTVVIGYYTMLAMLLNTFDVAPKPGDIPWRRGAAGA